ncbi:MAG TPA: hypothetical protein VKX49_26230 [Bryobacteraceae bacterium]|nr:hypothetical protein [Bryobacteraceae bacterium]
MYPFSQPQATIAGGQSLSGTVLLGDGDLVSIQMPQAWTAAALTFQGSVDGVSFFELFDGSGNEIEIPAAAATAGNRIQMSVSAASMGSPVTYIDFRGCPYIKVRSGTAAAPVNQAASCVLTLVVRKRRPSW